jgi:hypothetical protein
MTVLASLTGRASVKKVLEHLGPAAEKHPTAAQSRPLARRRIEQSQKTIGRPSKRQLNRSLSVPGTRAPSCPAP